METAAAKFLKTGHVDNVDPKDLAEHLRLAVHREVQRSTVSGLKMARRFEKRARLHRGVLLQAALRSVGWAFHVGNQYTRARDAYTEARRLARNDPLVRGRIDRILVDVYMYLGDNRKARKHARLSMATFDRLGNQAEREATRVNFANLLHRQDRHKEAWNHYRQARRFFEKSGDRLKLALCAYNEANTLVQLIDFPEALVRYGQARTIFDELGYELYANEANYGVAWLYMLQGEYHRALTLLSECRESYRRHRHPRGIVLCLLDMAEVYLNLNLNTDALNAARQAEKHARRLGIDYEAAKAAFFRAHAACAVGRPRECRQAVERSRAGFHKAGNTGFLAALGFLELVALADREPDSTQLKQVRSLFSRAQLPVWEAVCDLWMLRQTGEPGEVLKRLKRNPAVSSIPHLMADWQVALGDLDASRGELVQARMRWGRAADILDGLRVKLPPLDLRSAYLKGRNSPHERLIKARAGTDPAEAAAWSERYRTAGTWAPLPERDGTTGQRQRVRQSLVELAQLVAAHATRLDETSGRRDMQSSQRGRALSRLQQRVRENFASLDTQKAGGPYNVNRLQKKFKAASSDMAVIQFQEVDADLYAFVHEREKTRTHRFVEGCRHLRQFTGWWQILLSRSMLSGHSWSRAALEEERSFFRELGDWLWAPLGVPADRKRVLLLPEGRISNLPWAALAPDGEPLVDRHDLVLAPSLRHFLRASDTVVRTRRGEILVGRTEELKQVRRELHTFLDRVGKAVTIRDNCRRGDWPEDQPARFWHYTGHAHLRSDNSFYSYLKLTDGPLFAADFRLMSARVRLVTLAACRTGQQVYLPGEESSGLVRSLLEMGARSVIASHWAVDDRSTAVWMKEFYARFLNGKSVHDAAREATTMVRGKFPSAYHWAAFSVFGAF